MSPVSRGPGILDLTFGVSLVLVSVAIAGLPPVTTDFALTAAQSGGVIAAAVLGALGLVGCWIAASFRSPRLVPGVLLLAAGIALWLVLVLVAEPTLGWRVGAVTVGLLSESLIAVGWFVLRDYPALAYVALPLLLVGGLVVFLAPTYTVLLAGLVGGPLATFAVVLLVLWLRRSRRQPSAAL